MAEQRGNMATEDSTDRDADGAASAVATTDAGATRTTFAGGHDRMEKIFKWAAYASGVLLVVVIALIFLQLVIQAIPALTKNNANFLTSSEWQTNPSNMRFGILELLKITVLSSVMALILAVPVAVGIATFLVQYVPQRLSRPLSAVIDLLAAVPSIIYGLWGIFVLAPFLVPLQRWLNENLGWFFLFKTGNVELSLGSTVFTAGIVLAIMILPIITSITRESLRQTPVAHQEAALALGATKWEVIRLTVFPYGRSGIVAGSMLALGRALGETIAVLIILFAATKTSIWSLFDSGYTFASKIASAAAEFDNVDQRGAYIAAGLVLFVLTFVVNAVARWIGGGRVNG
ncbi:Phosphate transport system permease protein pstC (plasmid) [Tsukamurella tyrosinosolvens]|uniref:Phosphate transport system permease protein n=2 Tax=Tsukamurella tyrosinosolvens TaxID=57704 RepID=A0A1H5A2X9_TSUTY|nr:phosphate ABC transporter permease subunit PstC [Tsukamurella tyrosinosolvens]SED35970.1 phosphate ABC transporter membrane protein 1, PhoT family [Tsukamurella tyrosinosolvens]VEH99456.1 Phosphate transport system permease protein pstC [Tsukamurella tyrosinosolvens]